jgi:alpha-beta hydrolase superfamily lysophospholipase
MRTLRAPATAEDQVFGGALAVVALHALAVAPSLLSSIAVVALAPAAWVAFAPAGRLVRTLLAAIIGLAASADGVAVHLAHAAVQGPRPIDVTGALAAIAGLCLIGLAFRIALRGRPRRTWLLAVPICLVVLQWFVLPVLAAGLATNTPRPDVPAAHTLGLAGGRDVTFAARDGTSLAGWYVPGRNGAAVVLLHGSHDTRATTLPHVRMLAKAGYAVLAYDARGHGASAGQTNALGWRGTDDLVGAVGFLQRQAGVDPDRIAAVGLSMGAEVALRAAADGVALRAVVADGAGASTLGDQRLVSSGPIASSVQWAAMRATELLSGEHEPRPLKELVGRTRVPVMLIASHRAHERTIDEGYRRRIGPRADLWYVADAAHTKALEAHPRAYAERVVGFLRRALAP